MSLNKFLGNSNQLDFFLWRNMIPNMTVRRIVESLILDHRQKITRSFLVLRKKTPETLNVRHQLMHFQYNNIHSFSILSDDRAKASSKTIPPHSAIQSFLLQMRVSSPVLNLLEPEFYI